MKKDKELAEIDEELRAIDMRLIEILSKADAALGECPGETQETEPEAEYQQD